MNTIFFADIHTHSPSKKGEWVIQNIHDNFSELPASFFSAGLHPWYIIKDTWQRELSLLAETGIQTNMLALGECGLDKVCTTDYEFQQQVFSAQIKLANQIAKPLILHCVRAHEDIMQLLEKKHNSMPVIFHGFNKGMALAEKIISKGYYLSFGEAILRPQLQEVFAAMPAEKIFLETDDRKIPIESVYETAASIRRVPVEELSLQLKQNVQTVFNIMI